MFDAGVATGAEHEVFARSVLGPNPRVRNTERAFFAPALNRLFVMLRVLRSFGISGARASWVRFPTPEANGLVEMMGCKPSPAHPQKATSKYDAH